MGLFPDWTWIVGLMLGATIGSFLNVVIYRMPRGKSLGEPTYSFCPKCQHRLGPIDLIPLFSWLIQAGKCRYCGEPIPVRYFAVELVNGIIWAGLWYIHFVQGNDTAKFIAFAAAASILVAMIWIDLELYIIPEQLNASLSLLGLAYGGYLIYQKDPNAWQWGIPAALAGWILGVVVFLAIAVFGRLLFKKEAMGEGDIKLARGIGAMLLPTLAMLSFGIAIVLGAVIGSLHAWWSSRRRPATAETAVNTEVFGTLLGFEAGQIRLRITESSQAQRAPVGQEVTFGVGEAVEFYRGNDRIGREAFWRELPVGSVLALHGLVQGNQNVAVRIGRDQQPQMVSLLRSGLGYLLGVDILGLFWVKLYEKWFGENPYSVPDDLEEFDAGPTMIPFGPYLALGAILAAVFAGPLVEAWEMYLKSVGLTEGIGNIMFLVPVRTEG